MKILIQEVDSYTITDLLSKFPTEEDSNQAKNWFVTHISMCDIWLTRFQPDNICQLVVKGFWDFCWNQDMQSTVEPRLSGPRLSERSIIRTRHNAFIRLNRITVYHEYN